MDATFSIKELVQVARKIFKVSGALVEAALKASGKRTFTLDEAKLIIKDFAERKI